jgi:hypothetical protein
LRPGETPLGIYENAPGQVDNCAVITTAGLHVYAAGDWEFAAYDSIRGVRPIPPVEHSQDKLVVSALALDLLDGSTLDLPIYGGDERHRDAWEVMRFIDRVTHDVQHPKTAVHQMP